MFLKPLFPVSKGSRKIGTARDNKRDTWVKCNSSFIFTFRNYIHEICQFVKFSLDGVQFFFFPLAAFYE